MTGQRPLEPARVAEGLHGIADYFAPYAGEKNPRKRGLILIGQTGTGKTTALRALAQAVQYLAERDLIPSYANDRYPKMISASELARVATQDLARYELLKNCDRLIIDDLGMEPTEVVSFGMPLHPVEDVLAYRYERRSETFIASNFPYSMLFNSGEGMNPKYADPRLEDRLHETMTLVDFLGRSYR